MRFTSNARPSLTPLGHRLLHLSESKLNQLEPALGGRDTATLLRKGVLVREAVKSAWRSVDEGVQAEMNDWSHKAAMGLDVIGEDDEEEEGECEDEQEGRWFEELVSSFGEDDFGAGSGAYVHEWADANVASAFDDVEYDEDDMEAYTLPSSPSPTVTTIAIPASPQSLALDFDVLPALEAIPTEVEILEVMDDEEDYETDSESELHYHFGSRSAHLTWPEPQPLQPIIEPLAVPRALPLAPHPTPLTPVSPFTLDYSDDLDECADSFLLPPPLVRSFSSDSTSSMREDDEDDACVTPPQYSCEELEEEAPNPATKVEDGYAMTKRALSGMGSWLGLQLDDDGEGVFA